MEDIWNFKSLTMGEKSGRMSEDNLEEGRAKNDYDFLKHYQQGRELRPGISDVERSQELLPGILDDITIDHITPKLSVSTCHSLSTLNHVWREAHRSRRVFDARVRSHSTETVIVIDNLISRRGGYGVIGVYSVRDNCFYELPPIPNRAGEIGWAVRRSYQCISMHGKLYVLGGVEDGSVNRPTGRVFVIDLAGKKQWKQCASMNHKRFNFRCGVADGKICVFGGLSDEEAGILSEMYDPELDIWCTTSLSMLTNQEYQKLGDNVFGFGNQILELIDGGKKCLFIAQGRFYCMTETGIAVLDVGNSTKKHLHSYKFDLLELGIDPGFGEVSVDSWTPIAVENELVAILRWHTSDPTRRATSYGESLLQSVGFGGRTDEIEWQLLGHKGRYSCTAFMSSISAMQL